MKPPENQREMLELFKRGTSILENAITDLKESEMDYIPRKGGWTIRQIIHHIVDGDDLWKTGVKIALGNEEAEFNLNWYAALPQIEWAKKWNYENRSIDISLALFSANRNHILQLLESVPDAWNKSVSFKNVNGEIEVVPVGFIIQMQADHVLHHVERIMAIREEIGGS